MMNINAQKTKGQIHGSINVNLYTDEPILPNVTPADAGKALVVDESGNIVAGEAGGLPLVTPSDNGKILQVENGSWNVKNYPINTGIDTLFDGTITITTEAVSIPFSAGTDLSHPETWSVKVDGNTLVYDFGNNDFSAEVNGTSYQVYYESQFDAWVLDVYDTIVGDELAGNYNLSIKIETTTFDQDFIDGVNAAISSGIITFTYDGDLQAYISDKSTKYVYDLLSVGHIFLAKVFHNSATEYFLGYVYADIDVNSSNISSLFIPTASGYLNTYPTSISTSDFKWTIST